MSNPFGTILRHWRGIRRHSQLSLACETGLSARHISFLETGRSRPSRNSILTLARSLDMPKPSVNTAMLAAGFAPEYPSFDLGDSDLVPMMEALQTILDNHGPLPAIVIDGEWQIVGGNKAAMQMMQILPFNGSLCTIDALLNDDPTDPVFLNWDTIASWTVLRLQAEAARAGGEGPLMDLQTRLMSDPRLTGKDLTTVADGKPFLMLELRHAGQALSLFTMLAEFGTAQDITMSERRIELFFAADVETKSFFENLSDS